MGGAGGDVRGGGVEIRNIRQKRECSVGVTAVRTTVGVWTERVNAFLCALMAPVSHLLLKFSCKWQRDANVLSRL